MYGGSVTQSLGFSEAAKVISFVHAHLLLEITVISRDSLNHGSYCSVFGRLGAAPIQLSAYLRAFAKMISYWFESIAGIDSEVK
jgi:hypothetical protein